MHQSASMDSCRTAIGEYGDYHCFFMILEVIWLRCPIFRSRGTPESRKIFSALRTAVRYNTKTGTGFLFVNNYVRHYPMSEHLETALQAFGKDGREVYADFGKQDIRDGDYFLSLPDAAG